MSIGKSVRLFLADGTSGGLLTAEIMNWTGHVMAAPRSDLAALLKRDESQRTGLYILLGDDPDGLDGSMAYIGEGDDISARLRSHAKSADKGGKDFWNRAIVLTSKDANLTKAHARYLESRLITLATVAKRAKLANGTAPPMLPLPEADISDMEYYIAQVKIILPVLGINLIRSAATPARPVNFEHTEMNDGAGEGSADQSPLFELFYKKEGLVATAREVDSEFTVFAGSQARKSWVGTAAHNYRALRIRLEEDGVIAPNEAGEMRFVHDHVFNSPSAAAAAVLGRASNGRLMWRAKDSDLTYDDWQSQGIEDSVNGMVDRDGTAHVRYLDSP